MKWKLTGRYLFSILLIVIIVIVVNIFIFIGMVIHQQARDLEAVSGHSAESFTRSFRQYLSIENNTPLISQEGKRALQQYEAWIQILDGNGHVMTSYQAPDTALDHYTPIEIIHRYKYMDDELHTYFLGEYEEFSYIIGIPNSKEHRMVFTVNVPSFLSFASRSILAMMTVSLLIAAIVGLMFSSLITKPVHAIIHRIEQLKQRNFNVQHPQKPGIYQSVFANLNDVSETLSKHEHERLKFENMRNEWISNVSHDLKTPLASIQGYAELLRDDNVAPHERIEFAKVIERQSIYMNDLLDDFHLTMRLKNQQMPLHLQETRMEPFIREIIIGVLNDPSYKDRNISFTSEAPELTLSIDQRLMKRALLNFIYNALIHNEHDVVITVTVSNECICIEDNGRGIAEEDLEHIFDRYYRGANTQSSTGTGLGMAIARDILTAHGLLVELASEVNKGTVVKIRRTL